MFNQLKLSFLFFTIMTNLEFCPMKEQVFFKAKDYTKIELFKRINNEWVLLEVELNKNDVEKIISLINNSEKHRIKFWPKLKLIFHHRNGEKILVFFHKKYFKINGKTYMTEAEFNNLLDQTKNE